MRSWPAFDLRFSFEGQAAGSALFGIKNFFDLSGPRVASAGSGFVLRQAAFYIGGDAGIDTFVGAERHIYEPGHIDRIPVVG